MVASSEKRVRWDDSNTPGSEMSGSHSNKSPKRNPSDTPSASATNEHGCYITDARLRSVLCHPLGLPLLCDFNDGLDPSSLPISLAQDQLAAIPDVDKVLAESVLEWRNQDSSGDSMEEESGNQDKKDEEKEDAEKDESTKKKARTQKSEDRLTKILRGKIESKSGERGFHAHSEVRLKHEGETHPPRIDILLSPAENIKKKNSTSTPYDVIEFGLKNADWSKKLDQNLKYMDTMVQGGLTCSALGFVDPVLCCVVTLEDKICTNSFAMRIGAFLCSRRDSNDKSDQFRMSLLWHDCASTLEEASKMFGKILQVTHNFRHWRSQGNLYSGYQYLSSSCCKCKYQKADGKECDVVLRSYDHRVRTSKRNPEIYLQCQNKDGIIGETKKIVDLFPGENDGNIVMKELDSQVGDRNPLESALWDQKGKRRLLIISTPYRKGTHIAKTPKAFIPLINRLWSLHKLGFVHADLRAYNVVFGDDYDDPDPKETGMIDFDYGGKKDSTCYPEGYKKDLTDGTRRGEEFEPVDPIDDWFALGHLIFNVHQFEDIELQCSKEYVEIRRIWTKEGSLIKMSREDLQSQIERLKQFLADNAAATYEPESRFLKDATKGLNSKKTILMTTGTPKKK